LSPLVIGKSISVAGRVTWWLVWFAVSFWLWLAFVGEWDRTEWVAAALAGAAVAGAAVLVREQGELRARFRVRWLRETARVPVQVVIDFGLLLRALPSRRRGIFHTRPTGPRGRGAEQAGRSAFLTTAATYSPNAYVVDVDRETGEVLLHDLVPDRRSEEPA
jgi:hypothetical protein